MAGTSSSRLARVSGLQKAVFLMIFAAGVVMVFYGNSTGIACNCPEGVPCECVDYTSLIAKIVGTILLAAGAGLWVFQRYRKVEIVG